ncbi:aldehyde dehydrogenase family protein [Henriciella aquimarina]|uniref:aldehyde dehydrogenase family protein n=1 Tax=Henriciella aquimarina TaxID=545261 RepID=UPI0009FBA486|nr:aldehyde dehydrogenase family protein [Henriciella aquimarina]
MRFDSDYRMLIDGQLVEANETLEVINPAHGTAFARCPRASRDDLETAVQAARRAFKGWKKTPIEDRRAALKKASALIMENADAFASLFTKEQGRPTALAKEEIMGAAYWLASTADLDLPVDITEDTDHRRIEVHHEPLGVVCAIVPWNFPMLLASWKIAPSLLTGNTIVLKPSPFTPLCTLKLGELLREVFPPGVMNIISGGDELGPWMTSHQGFSKISFTGSTATGKRVMESAARDLKKVTLELGGNDAAVVLPDVDVDKVTEHLFNGAFANTSQICVATKRLYVHEDVYDAVRDRMHQLAKAAAVGDGSDQGNMFGPIQNKAQYERVLELLEDARKSGLTLLQGSDVPGEGYFIPLTIVDNPPENSRVVKEEAFGPVLPMMKFRDIDEVIGRVNDTDYGLAGSVWSADIERAREIASDMESGTIWINQNLQSTPLTPITGHKQSGIGSENGVYGLREFTQPKAIYIPKSADSVA